MCFIYKKNLFVQKEYVVLLSYKIISSLNRINNLKQNVTMPKSYISPYFSYEKTKKQMIMSFYLQKKWSLKWHKWELVLLITKILEFNKKQSHFMEKKRK